MVVISEEEEQDLLTNFNSYKQIEGEKVLINRFYKLTKFSN